MVEIWGHTRKLYMKLFLKRVKIGLGPMKELKLFHLTSGLAFSNCYISESTLLGNMYSDLATEHSCIIRKLSENDWHCLKNTAISSEAVWLHCVASLSEWRQIVLSERVAFDFTYFLYIIKNCNAVSRITCTRSEWRRHLRCVRFQSFKDRAHGFESHSGNGCLLCSVMSCIGKGHTAGRSAFQEILPKCVWIRYRNPEKWNLVTATGYVVIQKKKNYTFLKYFIYLYSFT